MTALKNPIAALFHLNDLTPHQRQFLEKVLPTQEKPLEKGLEKAGRLGVSAIGGPESLLAKGARVGAGALGSQLAEEAGAPEELQSLIELAAFMSPKFGKNLVPRKSQKEAVDFLRQQGLTDKEITPLIRKENFLNRTLSRIASKGKKTEKLGEATKSKLGAGFDVLKEEGAEKFIKGSDAVAFDDKISDVIGKINPRFGRLIEKDVEALRNKGVSQKNIIDFWQDINAIVKKEEGGKAVLGILKKPLLEGLEKIDPEAAKKFVNLNNFYAKSQRFQKSLKPGLTEKLLTGGKYLGLIGSIATLNFGFLPKIIGVESARALSRELLINPRLQNLSLQITKSLAGNKLPVALRTYRMFVDELRKKDPELADKLVSEDTGNNDS